MKSYLRQHIENSLSHLGIKTDLVPSFEKPRIPQHGDLSTNFAILLAKSLKTSPEKLAYQIIEQLQLDFTLVNRVYVAGPGFINFYFTDQFYQQQLKEILQKGTEYGKIDLGKRKKTQVEFVSANPTGPLTVGHGRGAVFGDTIARLLEWTNHDVTREYYFNNAGRQMRILGESVKLRYLEILGEQIQFPDDYYQGQYIKDIANELYKIHGEKLRSEQAENIFKQFAEQTIFNDIKYTLSRLGITFDVFYNENTLYETGKASKVIDELRKKNLAYDLDGAVWFKATTLGAAKDKVIVKSTGEPTYRLPDIAYHCEKFHRGFELIIDVFGADHIATYPDVLAGLKALGYDDSKVKVLIHQFVTIVQNGKTVKMSTRKANFITLDELIDEVGPDVVRFFFLMRRIDSHLNFDLLLAKEQSEENPVYYLQYAHARIASILRYADSEGIQISSSTNFNALKTDEEINLMKLLTQFPDLLESCTLTFEPHRLVEYLTELAENFHKFYHLHRVVTNDTELASSRLALCQAVKTVLSNGLALLGISAPDKM